MYCHPGGAKYDAHVWLRCLCLCRLTTDAQDFFTSYDEVFESFDSMGLQENLLRGIYAYGKCIPVFSVISRCSHLLCRKNRC